MRFNSLAHPLQVVLEAFGVLGKPGRAPPASTEILDKANLKEEDGERIDVVAGSSKRPREEGTNSEL